MDTPKPTETQAKRGFTYPEAAVYLGVSTSTVKELVYNNRLVARKIGARRVIDRAELDRYFDGLEEA